MAILKVLLEISVYSAILFAAIMSFKKLFKGKLSPALNLAVWMLLIIRLMLPVTFDTAVHFITLPGETIQIDYNADDTIQTETAQIQAESEVNNQPTNASAGTSSSQTTDREADQTSALTVSPVKIDWAAVLVGVWVAGMIVCAGMAVCGYTRIRRSLRLDDLQTPDALKILFDECRSELKINGRVRLSVQRFAHSPALLFPSNVLVPVSMLDMEHKKVKWALMHELTHYMRKDQFFAMLLFVLRIVYWFNPVVYIAERIIRDDIETACDSNVVRRLSPDEKGIYARSLIAMYQSSPETQMVLGMALGSTRKGAENRIRGIYMKQKSQWHVKLTAVLLAGVMAVCCFTTACQPMPVKPVIVNKNQSYDNMMSEYVGQISESIEPYTVPERITENIEVGHVTIHADIPVELPQSTDFPVTIVRKRTFTQEDIRTIVDYFAKGRKMYKEKTFETKDEIMDMITEAERGPLVNGVFDPSKVDENRIKELEQRYKSAPETFEKEYVDLNRLDNDGSAPEEGKISALNVNIENDKGVEETLNIMNAIDSYQNTDISYNDGSVYYNETFFRENLDASDIDVATDPNFQDWENQLKNTSMTQDEAITQGNAVLQALPIDGLVLTGVDRAALLDVNGYPCKGGYELTYMRSKGNLTGFCSFLWAVDVGAQGEVLPEYAPPFEQERVKIMLNEDGLHCFYWFNVVTEDQTVSENARLIPFDEVRQAVINQIKYKYSFRDNTGAKLRCEIESAKLQLGYIGVKDNINRALMVPMWVFVTEFLEKNDAETSEFSYGYEALAVNALDGSIVSIWPPFNH